MIDPYAKYNQNLIVRVVTRAYLISRELFSANNRSVNFIIAGIQKGGTTALDYYLRQHPDICMASRKEVHYFDNDLLQSFPNYLKKLFYHSFFCCCEKGMILGEATPIYTWWPNSLERIKEYNPSLKLIIILRDPVRRAYSHWNMEKQRGNEDKTFSEAIRRDHDETSKSRVYSYVSRGFYSSQIKKAMHLFSSEQLLFVKHDDLLNKPEETLENITTYLGVTPLEIVNVASIHVRVYESPMSKNDEIYLRRLYMKDIQKVEHLLEWDLREWKVNGGIDE